MRRMGLLGWLRDFDVMQKLLALLLVVMTAACIDPIPMRIEGGGTLVVDGWITNEPGPVTIKVSRSIAFDNSQPLKVYTVAERKAVVSIIGSDGSVVSCTEGLPGSYVSKPLMGVVGTFWCGPLLPVAMVRILSTTSVPPTTLPKTE